MQLVSLIDLFVIIFDYCALFGDTHYCSLFSINFLCNILLSLFESKADSKIGSIIGLIAIIASIGVIHFCISVTVVQDDDLVDEPFEEPSDEP